MRREAWHAPRTPVQPCLRPGATLAADFCAGRASVFALGCESGDVVVCDAAKPDLAPTLVAALDTAAWDVVWAPEDAAIAAACGDGCLRVYACGAAGFAHTHTLEHADVPVRAVRYMQPGVLASAGRDGAVRIWDLRMSAPCAVGEISDAHACAPEASLPATPRRRNSGAPVPASVGSLAVIDSNTLATVGQPGLSIRFWDVRSLCAAQHAKRGAKRASQAVREIAPLTAPGLRPRAFLSLALSPDGAVLYAPSADNAVHAYATAGSSAVPLASYTAPGFRTAGSFYTRCAPSPCGRYLACGSAESTAYVFDLDACAPARPASLSLSVHGMCVDSRPVPQAYTLGEHRHETTCVAWSRIRDGPEYVLAGGEDYVVRTWSSDRSSRAALYDAGTHCLPSAVAPPPAAVAPGRKDCKSTATPSLPVFLDPWPSADAYRSAADAALLVRADDVQAAPCPSPMRTPLARVCENSVPASPQTPSGRKRQLALDVFFSVPGARSSPCVP